MSPQWIPQNIQKRLLLYVLNQLSLFSEVDLPNLEEVSLNNITLKDISIDPEKAGKLPGFNLRHGKVGFIELTTISGISGVKIDAKEVDIVVSPDYDDDNTASHSQFLLAQTTADLANTIMLETDNYEMEKSESAVDSDTDSEDSTPIVPTSRRRSSTISNNSTLGNVMQRAMEMALSRLQISISNLNIKLITESTDLLVEVEEVKIVTVNGTRNIKVNGVTIKTLRPSVPSGENEFEAAGTETTDKPEDEENDNSSDYGEEALMNSMVFTHEEASSIYMSATSQSFGKSIPTEGPLDNKQKDEATKEPPILFHMNSCEIEFDGLKAISNLEVKIDKVKLASVPTTATLISIFEGITKTLKVKLYQMKRKSSSKGQRSSERFPQYPNDDDDVDSESPEDVLENEPLFNSVTISSLQITLSAAIKMDGSFAKSGGPIINLENITAKQKNELRLFGSIETVEIIRFLEGNEFKIFYFENLRDPGYQRSVSPSSVSSETSHNSESTKADFRFEVFQNEDDKANIETTLLLAKAAYLNLDEESLGSLLKIANDIMSISACYSKFKGVLNSIQKLRNATGSTPNSEEVKQEHLIIQTASINMLITTRNNLKLQIRVLPISYDSMRDGLNIASITGHGIVDNQPIGTLFSITGVNVYPKSREFKAFIQPNNANSNRANYLPRASTLNTSLMVSISNIEYVSTLGQLKLLVKELQILGGSLSEKLTDIEIATPSKSVKHLKIDKSSYLLSSSSNLSKNRRTGIGLNRSPVLMPSSHRINQANYCIHVERVSIKVDDILPKFGSLKMDVIDIKLFKLKNDVLGSVLALNIVRMKKDLKEDVLYQFQGLEASSIVVPLITFKYKSMERASTLEISARDFLLEYYTHWLSLFGKDESIIEHVEEELIDTTPPKRQPSSHRFDVRLTMYNCLIGLTPGRLECKGYLTVSKGNVDFVIGAHQFHIKSSLRDIAILLIDDMKNVSLTKESKIDQTSDQAVAADVLINRGYIQVGSINLAHIGLTFNTNIEEIRRRNHELEIRDCLSIIDFKINTDEIQLDLCADSANTFIQMISDLKLPYDFDDKDKMKVSVNEDVNILNGVDSNIFKNITESFAEMDLDEEPVSVEASSESSSGLEFQDEHFDYVSNYKSDIEGIDPLKVNINLSRVEVYLYDGYDWKDTRKSIRGAVKKIESEQKKRERGSDEGTHHIGAEGAPTTNTTTEQESSSVIQETLYQSIYVSAPKAAKGNDLTKSINFGLQNDEEELDDHKDKVDANIKRGKNYKNLKLRRSAYHKVVADLKSIDIGVVVYSTRDPRRDKTDPDMKVELLNLVELGVGTVDVYDNVPSSTWNKFLSYMNILGEREVGTSMAKVSILNVRPKPNLVAAEAIMKVSVLPLRFHVDQDTLDFMTRFFDFRDSRFELPPDEILYIQKFEISPIKLKVDYKPKKVDFIGLRSGRTAEFANFFILDGSKITLPRAHLFGMSGVPELMRGLGKAWAPVFQSTQVLGIVSGVSSLRSVVNIGGGFKDLYVVSRKEYQKDGRFWRSLQKGTSSFAKTTGYELVNMGVKLASGTQVLLEQGEEMLGGEGSSSRANRTTRRGSDEGLDTSMDLGEAKSRNNGGGSGNVLLSSQILSKQAAEKYGDDFRFNGQKKLYSNYEFDDEEDDTFGIDREFLNKSIFLLPEDEEANTRNLSTLNESDEDGNEKNMNLATGGESIEEDDDERYDVYAFDEVDEDELKQKMVSLYSNQPETFQQGLLSAYRSLGKNFKLTGKQLTRLKKELDKQETVQDSIVTVLKNSPVILIRPMIGTTEALSKALMGIGNVIDPKHMVEIKDKYRSESSDDGK
ncbi:Spo72 protein [Candida orthopsilosis Co 90-125]|uniref:Autophagy-related protein 2 n=1 Tax=Candida orthopsilosis (strain 90-125) TaxID=1136231 RepID=H8WYH4_CANO9|nr:Spo72 protein [Candida orthopsilosis Co 90-125]CCG21289.1 Spo72 protein [Candida orthopsilosis Co 90-125]